MSNHHFYKERLGLDPTEDRANGTRDGHNTGADFKTFGGYEESLSKFKDERDAIQKKTFTKWVNKHLKKAGKQVRDLFEDLRDGHNLLSLLEVLSGEHLPRERGRLRFHMLQNVQLTLDFLRYRKIKLVNIRCEDIVDGNPKLTLGLIWTIILHFQISDIMVGQADNLTAKEALLRWARNTTHKYPAVEVKNFTTSWRDGLAFVAIIHRNRSDLVDWRNLRQRTPRERLETAFHVMEREYGVTRLLDAEDVDTPEPDEKSLITYVSQLYEIFPEPPSIHPLFNIEAQRKLEEYRELASTLLYWVREHISIMRDRHFPTNTIELKRMAHESTRFRQEEVPPRLRDKNGCQRLYREIQKLLDGTGFLEDQLASELHYNNVDSEWNKLMSLYQERDDALHDSLSGADRLQRLAEKVHREIKQTEITLEEVEIRIEDEARRVERLHPMDAKRNCDALDGELAQCEDTIKTLHTDVKVLREGKYHEAPTLHKRVVKLEERYVSVRTLFENRLLIVLNNRSFTQQESFTTTKRIIVSESRLVDTNEHFRFLQECINWCKDKLKKLNDSEYGNDLAAVEREYESHQKEHKIIHQFHTNVDQCAAAENNFNGEEHTVYINLLSQLRKIYAELLSLSNKRVSDLHSLLDFLQSATQELIWLNEREEQELNRDWANKSLNITDVERYYEKLMGELEKREVQFSSVQDRGNSLVIGHHPASKTVEAYLAAMQTQWQWLLELTLCLETHLQHAAHYHTFFTDISTAEQWVMAQDEKLNSTFSVTDFGLDDGEQLLREMQDVREELAQFNVTVDELIARSKTVVPLKQRRQTLRQPTVVTAICNYKKMDMSINKGERCTVHDNSNRVKWSVVTGSGSKGMVPGVCFTIPPPNQEAIDSAEKLKRQYERCIALWQKKQLRMRQNMIFATIKVVKSWDLAQFIAMGADQRNAIRRALNEDAEKLLQEGDPNDPQLRRLKREIDEVNRLFDEFERRASEPKPGAVLVEQCTSLKEYLDMMEKMLIQRCLAGIPRDLDLLEQLVIEHKQFENDLSSRELEVESIQKNYQNLTRRTPAIQRTVEAITQQWDRIWALSHVYIERMKCVEMVVTGIEEGTQVVSEIELKLAEHQDLPDELEDLEREHRQLLNIQQMIHDHQALIDRLLEECRNVRTLVVKSRPSQKIHPDVDKLEEDVRKLRIRWENMCSQIIERLRSCEAASELLMKYRNGHAIEKKEINDLENGLRIQKIEDLGPSEAELELERLRQAMIEKYRQCDATIVDMVDNVSEIERRLAEQEPVSENSNGLRNQINTVKAIKDELDEMFRPLGTCLDAVRQVVNQGGEVLSREELESLDQAATALKQRYDHCVVQADTTHRRLTTAMEEFSKYEKEIALFQTWLTQATRTLLEKERLCSDLNKIKNHEQGCRDFLGDVIAHQADLRFITMATQKFLDESSLYLRTVNNFRTTLPERYPLLTADPDSMVRDAADEVSAEFKGLLARANKLVDKATSVGNRQRDYTEAIEKATRWLKDTEVKVSRLLQEPVGADPKGVQDQLDKAKAINNDVVAQSRLFENCRATAVALLRGLEGELTAHERDAIERPPEELAERYSELADRLGLRCQELDTALVQCQGVQEGLDSLMSWLNNIDLQLKNASKPASLNRDRLDEQLREHRQLHADIMSHQASVVQINDSAEALLSSASNARVAKKIETKLRELNTKFEKVVEKSESRGLHLEAVSTQLDAFTVSVEHFEEWYIEIVEIIESREVLSLDVESYARKIDEIARQRDVRSNDFDGMILTGKDLVSTKDVTDTAPVKDKIKNLEGQWKELNDTLDERARNGKERSEQLLAYEQLRDRCIQWLTTTENTLEHMRPVGLEQEIIRKQIDDLKPLLKEHREYGTSIDQLNELGNAYDALLRGERPESPTRRRSSVTPVKRVSISSPLKQVRRASQDVRGSSPGHKILGYNGSAPMSPIPGGYGSRRTSQDGFHLDDMSPIQKELMQVNTRYEMISMKLNDRQNDLDIMKEELKKLSESMRTLSLALDKAERSVPRESIPTTKEEADKYTRQCKTILEDLQEKHPALDTLKVQVVELIKRSPNAPGADILQDQVDHLNDRFKELQGRLKDRITFLESTKDFLDSHDTLNNWLISKDRMMTVLGPIASDPRMVQMQAQQVQVLRDEFQGQESKLSELNDSGDSIIGVCEPNSMAAKKINDKLDGINNKWTELIGQLDARDAALNAASDASTDFYNNYNKLHDTLLKLGDDFDDVIASGADSAKQIEAVNILEHGLEKARGNLIDLEGLGEHLMSILSDPSSKNDIKSKVTQLNKMFNNLEKKLGNRKSELEASLRDEEEFGQSCQDIQEWLSDQVAHLKDQIRVSADKDILSHQVADFEPIYKDLMAKEHEVIMMINKGKDIVAKSSRKDLNRQLTATLDAIKKEWDNVRKTAVDRRTRLQKCMDTCNKFHSLQDKFNPWLDKAEEKVRTMEPIAFAKRAIDKQIKEIQSFKNEVSRHSGEFENNKTGGEKLIGCTDTDHDGVHDALSLMKERWDHLNAMVFARAQDLDDVAAKLADFNDKTRDVDHTLQRCGDKLASLDALVGTGKDAKSLERMKALLEETEAMGKQVDQVKHKGEDLCGDAETLGSDAHHIQDEVERLADRYGDLRGKLEDRCHDLEEASQAVNQFGALVKNVAQELTALEDELERMGPVGRDIKVVTTQTDQLQSFMLKVDRKCDEIEDAKAALEELVSQGFAASNNRAAEDQIKQLQRQMKKVQDRCDVRGKDLDTVLKKLENFYDKYNAVMDDITEADKEGEAFKAVGADVDTIMAQQEDFKRFKSKRIEIISKPVSECNKLGQGLIQSAASGVNTQKLEDDIDALNDLWNKLKQMVGDREKALDKGLMQSGKFQDALDSMLQWLGNFEEMMENQAPISGEYSVVKAQAQEQKFLRKMLMDRQNEMQALLSMGRNLSADLEPSEKAAVEGQLDDLLNRFDDANARSQERMEALDETLRVAKEFQNKLNPISEWLDRSEKKLKEMSTVPSDEEKIQRLIREHDSLHDDILGKKPAFDDLTDVATALMSLVGDDEANALADKLQATTDRYGQLVEDSEAFGRLLQESKVGLRHLVLTYEDLLSWMDEMEARLSKYRVLSVFVEKLLEQMDELTDLGEEVVSHEKQVGEVMDAGSHLMKHISSDEALQLKDKLDSIHRRYNDLSAKATDLHKAANEALPLVQQFHSAHDRLGTWMLSVEGQLQSIDSSSAGLMEEEIERLAHEIQENRPLVEAVNLVGPQLCQISPGEGATNIETLVTRDNRRFEQLCEQIQRRMERIHMSKQRSQEVTQDIDELLGWFREVEGQIREAEPPSVDPEEIRIQLKEHKALNDDVASQKGRVRDVLSNAKKVLRESPHHEDTSELREKMDDLKETMESVSKLSSDRLSTLEQALPLAEHFYETHHELDDWLTGLENEAMVMDTPALRPDQIIRQMEKNKAFLQSIADHKPLLDKLNKTGGALLKLVNQEDGAKIQDLLESDNDRYNALKYALRERSQALEDALQETSQFSDKLDGMLSSLAETADQVKNAEPISAHPEKIHEQVQENNGIIDDLERKETAFAAVKAAAEDVINKASRNDPAVKDIKTKLDRLNKLWDMVQMATTQRGQSLEDALAMAEKFWDELQNVMAALKELQETLKAQEPVAVEPQAIKQQREELSQIKNKIDQAKPEVEQVRQTGRDLMTLCGDQDKPEVKKNIEDLDYAWDNVTALYAKREENLIDAMEKAMEFHDTLRNMLEFLEKAEDKFGKMGPIAGDIEAIKTQINQLHRFKDEVDPHMVKVEALNRSLRRQAQELKERTTPDQAAAIMVPLGEVNQRWEELLKGIVQRQRNLEYALLKLGQFQHALKELMVWIERTTKNVDDLKPVFGDPQVIEVELAKLKVTINDIQAHQSSVDTLNDAGRQLIEADKGSEDASITQKRLTELNKKWGELQDKAGSKQSDLESALREAQIFSAEIQDLLLWLGDIDAALSTSRPVGGLPETAKEQLLRFMEIYEDLEENRPKVEEKLQQGQEYLKRSREGAATNLNHSLRTLKQRWESVMNRANDKKIKLEIAMKEATEFHDALQSFVDWLTEAENTLNSQQPVSRVLDIILQQIEEHNHFKKDVTAHREVMLSLDKKGTHLKYFSQKQDVILIKNLLVSVQHRWEKVVSKAAERTRALDLGFKEAKDFHDNWNELVSWLDDAENTLDDLAANVGNDPEKIRAQIAKHKEFQKALGAKQPFYDSTMKQGRGLQNKAPKTDDEMLKQMLMDLKNKWNSVCQKSVDRQRKLEEALLFTGQFKDATQALLDWLKKVELGLVDDGPVHGDLDTVMALVEQHKAFCAEMKNRSVQVESVRRTADELLIKANPDDAATIRSQISELVSSWEKVERATEIRTRRLEEALQAAEQLHKVVHMLLDWLSDAEMKLRYAGPLPDSEAETRQQISEHDAFMAELGRKEKEKDDTIALAEDILAKAHPDGVATIKHWITIIQSRWEEVMAWARQRQGRLSDHLRSLSDLAGLLDELMRWLIGAENNLTTLEAEPLPDDIPAIEGLITDHKEFMDEMQKKEPDVLSICKPTKPRPSLTAQGKKRSRASIGRESVSPGRETSPDYDYPSRRSSRISPDRESSPGNKSRKSSRASPSREVTPTREYPRPWMFGARTTPPRETSPGADREREWPLGNLRFATSTTTTPPVSAATGRKSSKASVREEPQIKNPQARALWEKWQHVGFMAWERMRRLHDKLNYLHELEKLKNFSWEEWRKRFMKFMNHKKSRVTDLFRKMDTDNDGAVPRDDFIDGILKTKFPTSRLEMGTVADIFDRNQDGYIDYQEFIAALRPDWERKSPVTDAERIDDEVQKQVSKCTCRQKFRVHQVGEGKYRFGDSQKLRLVRILRSTVMVRVGGGWVALDEFLVKNDPCRAKGRTNVELREQFILAEGVSQSMTPFKSKPSPNSSVSSQSGTPAQRSQSVPNSGPIIKVRERTAKSSGMGRSSFSAGTPDSSFSEEGVTSSGYGKRKASAPVTSRSSYNTSDSQPGSRGGSRPASRGPGSRPGSRPPSRAGSEVSLDSNDGGRTPMRRTPSFSRTARTSSSQSSGVQRSSSLRKASAPVRPSPGTVNGTGSRTLSVSSRLYSPTLSSRLKEAGIRTNLSGSTSNLTVPGTPLRSRTSSTTSLNSNHSTTSKIPTLRPKTSTTNTSSFKTSVTTPRTRNPSGSSSHDGTTKVPRRTSGLPDTPTGSSRKTGIVEPKRRL